MYNVQGKAVVYLVGMLLRPILRGIGKVVNKLILAKESLGNPWKSWKRESCKKSIISGPCWYIENVGQPGKPWKSWNAVKA